jgi:multisubunit Na+/H+ antiporter MnhF subunit
MMILGGLLLLALSRRSSFDLDAALMVALFSFGGTMAATRYFRKGTIFS